MRKPMYLVIVAAVLVTTAAASSDPFIGKWVLDPRQSKYPPGECPKRMVIEMDATGQGIRYRSEAVYANGGTTHSQYTAEYNSKPVLVLGTNGMLLPVSLKRLDLHTVVASYFKSFEVVATSRRVVSHDGRRMTITTTSRDRFGKSVTTVGVYERQIEPRLVETHQ
jgi:hypothetical protein